MEIDQQAFDRVKKARAELILARRFYGVLVSNVEPVMSRRVPRAGTNSKQHFWNPDYVMSLPQKQIVGVQAHESEHDARHHGTRRGARDPEKWNEACDFAINIDLIDQGFELPEGVLIDERFRGMSADDIYRTREIDEQRAQQQQQPQPQPEPEDDQSEGEDEGDDTQEPESDNDEGDGGSGSDESSEDEQSEDGEGTGKADSDDGDDAEGETGSGKGDDGDQPSEPAQGEGQSQGEGEDEGDNVPQSCGDAGGCGEVFDSAEDAADMSDTDHKWERVVRQAVSMAKAIGQLPGHVTADIERANNRPQDWRDVLRTWIDSSARRIETWNRPNRRFCAQGIVLPSSQRDGVNRIACIVDTSASMDDMALACIRTELQSALDDHVADEVVVIYNDVRVTRVDTFVQGDELIFDPRGRGGTDLRPAFAYVREEIGDVSGMLIFTDMEIGDPGSEPDCPVLFAAYGYPDKVRQYLANAPWGAPGIDVGEH